MVVQSNAAGRSREEFRIIRMTSWRARREGQALQATLFFRRHVACQSRRSETK